MFGGLVQNMTLNTDYSAVDASFKYSTYYLYSNICAGSFLSPLSSSLLRRQSGDHHAPSILLAVSH